MINKIPKEEFEALFEELYKTKSKPKALKEKNIKSVYSFYAYKFLKLFNKFSVNTLSFPLILKKFEIEKLNEFNKNLFVSLGYDIEEKYRFYILIEEESLNTIDIFLLENTAIKDNFQKTIIDQLKNTFDEILKDLKLNFRLISPTFPKFYSNDVIHIRYYSEIFKNEVILDVYLDENFFDSEIISKYIFIFPSSVELNNISKLLNKVIN